MTTSRIINFFKRNYLVIVFFFVVGFVSVAPQILSIIKIGNEYKGIHFIYINDELTYMAGVRDVVDGHWLSGSPFFYEYKYLTPTALPWGNYFYAILVLISGISLVNILILSKFLFPALLFILVYLLIIRLTENENNTLLAKISAVTGGLFVTLGYDLLDYRWLWAFLTGEIEESHLLLWTRPVNPITGALLIFVFLFSIRSLINRKRVVLNIFVAGAVSGLMIYYFFSWGIALSFLGSVILIDLFRKKYRDVVYLFFVSLINFFVSLPFWLNIFKNAGSTDGNRQLERMGMYFTHAPVINKVLLATLLFFLPTFIYRFFKQKKTGKAVEEWWWFCLSLVLSGFVAFNQQIITGRTIWYHHFVQYTIPFCMVILIVWLFNFVRPRCPNLWLLVVSVIAFSSLMIGIKSGLSYNYNIEDFKRLQNYGNLVDWLNNNAPKDCVVLVKEDGEELTNIIPAFTHCNVFVSPWVFEGVPEDRNYYNYLTLMRIRGVTGEESADYLLKNQLEVRDYFFSNWDEHFAKNYDSYIDNEIRKLDEKYQNFIKEDFSRLLEKYRLDYIIADKDLNMNVKSQLPTAKYIKNFNNLFLYKFN